MTFPAFGSIPRLHRHFTLTEKIDGTSGIIAIYDDQPPLDLMPEHDLYPDDPQETWFVAAGSRNRWLKANRTEDNHGLAQWVQDNAATLIRDLGPGLHYGEWWGAGIGRGYGLPKGEKRFSLFNTSRWEQDGDGGYNIEKMEKFSTPGLSAVPELYDSKRVTGDDPDGLRNLSWVVGMSLKRLATRGSLAAEGFMRPEGIIVYHSAANQYFKVTLEKDDIPKSVAAKQREQKVSA